LAAQAPHLAQHHHLSSAPQLLHPAHREEDCLVAEAQPLEARVFSVEERLAHQPASLREVSSAVELQQARPRHQALVSAQQQRLATRRSHLCLEVLRPEPLQLHRRPPLHPLDLAQQVRFLTVWTNMDTNIVWQALRRPLPHLRPARPSPSPRPRPPALPRAQACSDRLLRPRPLSL
jgi:uncharacterized coiled-coil protein SlyX